MAAERTWYEWRVIHNGIEGKTPNVRISMGYWMYQDHIWLVCGSGSGLGKSSEVWKFSTADKSWDRVKCTGEPPKCRDGHSGTYIGDGKFIIFGGQGFPEPNWKLGRESESMKTKTYNKREVYNDLLIFNCDTLQWSPIYPDGLSIPMGRRAHSAIYIPPAPIVPINNSNGGGGSYSVDSVSDSYYTSMTGSVTTNSLGSGSLAPPGTAVSQAASFADNTRYTLTPNSVLVFGGVGIELSKYTEQLYNELWCFSFDSNQWSRPETRGMEPRAVYDHQVEVLEDNMIVVGGITEPSKVSASLLDASPFSDVMLFNLQTSTWSYLKIRDSMGLLTRFNFHGFSLVADRVPDRKGILYIFGGRQVVDSKYAATSKVQSVTRPYANALSLILNVKDGTLIPANVRKSSKNPEDRYGHLGVSAVMNINNVPTPAGMAAGINASTDAVGKTGQRGQKENFRRRGQRQSGFFDMMQETQTEEQLLYVFGGSSLVSYGFCDPLLFQLVRVVATGDSSLLKQFSFQGDPAALDKESSDVDSVQEEGVDAVVSGTSASAASAAVDGSGNTTAAAGTTDRMLDTAPAPVMSVGFRDIEDSSRTGSPQQFMMGGGGGGGTDGSLSRGSIWENLQNKVSEKDRVTHEPSNWSELKLALSPPLSQRFFVNKEDRLEDWTDGNAGPSSRPNTSTAVGGGRQLLRPTTTSRAGGRSFTAPAASSGIVDGSPLTADAGGTAGLSMMGPGGGGVGSHSILRHSASADSPLKNTSRLAGLSAISGTGGGMNTNSNNYCSSASPSRPGTSGGALTPSKSKSVMFRESAGLASSSRGLGGYGNSSNNTVGGRTMSGGGSGGGGYGSGASRPNTAPGGYGHGMMLPMSATGGRRTLTASSATSTGVLGSSAATGGFASTGATTGAMGAGVTGAAAGDVNGGGLPPSKEEMEAMRKLRIKELSTMLKPVVKSKTKVDARKEYQKLFPPPKHHF